MVAASYEIALVVAKNKRPHTREELIMPAAKVLLRHVIGDEAALKLNYVSLSNNMSTDIHKQVFTEVQSSKYGFAIQTGRNNGRVKLRTASSICALCY